ncbi:MAG: efflux RND transporter permease subunit, partial [Bacillota bacterium]|nr:efflux RND transporter permease subunit [Bacillota bacterium]
GDYINIVISSVLRNLLLGGILAILILLFFLRDIRPTIITAISIPVSVVFALAMMYFTGVTLNMISLSGLAIGIGMLVDNSIVVIENIYRLRSMGYSLVQSAVSGAVQVAGAITASTLTTICVFAPIVFVSGMTRDIFSDLALTVAYSLMASLFIALTLVPAMAKSLLVKTPKNTVLGQKGRVVTKYREVSAWALCHKKWILIGAVVLLFASSGLLLTRGFAYMPSMSTPQVSADITMPEGSTLKETAAANDEMMNAVRKIDGVETVGAMLSSGNMITMSQDGGEENVTQTSMYVVLDEKKADQGKTVARTLKSFEKKYGCKVVTSADMDMTTMMGGSDVSISLFSDDLDDLRSSAHRVEERMREMKGLEDISDIEENSTEELHVSVDKNYAMTEGLTVAQIYQQIAARLRKEEKATTLKLEDGNIDVTVENFSREYTVRQLEEMRLTVDKKDGTKEKIRLTEVADIEKDASLKEISHEDKNRCVKVTASIADGYNVTLLIRQIRNAVNGEHLLAGDVTADYGGQNEEIMDAMRQMLLMMIIGIVLVYLIMVAQFQSVRSPLIVIFAVPLAFTGGMLALLLCGQVFSVIAMFGMVMLMGIVVNNAIVFVDCVNRFRLEGMDLDEAIIHGGAVRMRPVIMTAMTTVLGLMPLALGIGNGAGMVQPLAIVCIGGLLYATATTLLVIPVMYRLVARKRMTKIKDEELEILTV